MNPLNLPVEIAEPSTGMAQAVFNELADRLQAFAEHGDRHVIDLTSLPMTSTDRQQLAEMLGQGEVKITLSTIGDSEIYETAYSGIWWIKHYSADQQLLSELIEVGALPEIVASQPEDIQQAAEAIKNIIDTDETGEQV